MKTTACILLGLALAVPSSFAQGTGEDPAPAGRRSLPRGPLSNYILQPSDLIQVRVFQEPDLDRELRISQDFRISLPLIGQITVEGMSARDLEVRIKELYDADFLVNPQVNVSVVQYAPRTISVLGSVNSPGPVTFPPEEPLRLVDAIARAGGFTRLARPTHVSLNRKRPDGSTQTTIINVEELMRGQSSEPWYLERDDVINVPERIF